MFTPSDMEKMPKELELLYADLELRIMQDIVRRLKINGEITRAADWQIYRLHELGESKKTIKKMLRETLNLSSKEVDKIYKEAIASGYAREEELYKATGTPFIPFKENLVLQQAIKAVEEQTAQELKNITQSLGFAENVNGKIQFTELSEFYQKTMDNAMLDISSGAFDYNTVLKRTVATMTKSGLRAVDYASGWSNRVEVASRRALMTGVTQITGKINEQNAERLSTDYFEVSWHGDARPSHQKWQGKVYVKEELETICGLGTVEGLGGANCRHTYYPFIPGISERTYTDEQLEEMNAKENTPKEFNGKQYTSYEASQKQRRMETLMRKQRQDIKLLQEGGADEDDIIAARCRYRKSMGDYVEFSEAMGIPQQRARVYVDGLGNVGVGKIKKQNKKLDNIHKDAQRINEADYQRNRSGQRTIRKSKVPKTMNKYGQEIVFELERFKNQEKAAQTKQLIEQLTNEYNSYLSFVKTGAKGVAGQVEIDGTMRLSSSKPEDILHEFGHTLASSHRVKLGLADEKESAFLKEITKIRTKYEAEYYGNPRKGIKGNTKVSISAYSFKSKDEFLAEAFTQAKAKQLGIDLSASYSGDMTYSTQVLEVVDKYFKKESLEKTSERSTIDLDLQHFAKKHKIKKVPNSNPLWDSLVQGDVEEQLRDEIFNWEHGGYEYLIEIKGKYNYEILSKKKKSNIHKK